MDRVGHLCSEVRDAVCLLLGSLVDVSVLTVFGARVYVQCYVLAMICVAYSFGVNPWVTIVPPLIPLFSVWLWIQMKRERNHLALTLGQQKEWNIDKTLKEYTELLEKQRKRDQHAQNNTLPPSTVSAATFAVASS